MSNAAPTVAAAAYVGASFSALEAEQTAIGVQTLVTGVAPITPAQRLALRANAPLEPKKPQRAADHGLFDTNARLQIEMF